MKQIPPLISFITICYNGLDDTCVLIESLRDTISSVSYEIIVVDNASRQDEASLIQERYPFVRTLRSEKNLGFSGGNNLGIQIAQGKYLFLINNDTYLTEDGLPALIERLESDPRIGAVSPKIRFAFPPQNIQFAGYTKLSRYTMRNKALGMGCPDDGTFDTPRPSAYLHGAALMLKREVIWKAGLMPEIYFLYYEELDWCVQIRRAGLKIWYEATSTVYHKESMSVGKQSPLQVYYHTRNRLLFAKRSIDKRDERIYAYIYQTLVAFPKRLSIYLVKGKFRLIGALGKGLINGLIAINKDMNYGKELSSH